MNRITAMVEITNPTRYNDAAVPGSPDSIVDPALSIMRALNVVEAGHYHEGRVVYALHKIT